MKSFKDFGIKAKTESFVGDKRKMTKILNIEIIVHKYKIVPSIYEGSRLDLQIELNGVKMVTWTSSDYMIQMIKEIPSANFPFTTTIKEIDEHYEFT
jgi:hypothetical protein